MFGFKKKKKEDNVLRQMDGREIKYVTKRTRNDDGTVKEIILGKYQKGGVKYDRRN